ncbi:MAG: beta-galactosidase [Planctomycetota bacterium]
MAEISYDKQAFVVGGRRVFLVGGALHYPRIPRELWRDRIRAAKQAGLNCIETYVFWNAHEKAPGEFDFTGDLNLRRFVEIVGEEGLWCWLRPGPYVCAEWDGGGLPAWLETVPTTKKSGPMKIREAGEPFLAACSRYISAVMAQVKDLQVVGDDPNLRRGGAFQVKPGDAAHGYRGEGGGPILLMQVENEWFSQSDKQHDEYHRQLVRYLREGGCRVPLNACNQLWQPVDGAIHTWNASADLSASVRQLGVVQPDAPRMVSEYWTGWFDQWGGAHADGVDAQKHLYRLASILSEGAMPNLFMFHGGTNFGFSGGRTVNGDNAFMTTSYDYDAPLREAGGRAEKFAATKRLCTFASQFAPVLACLEPTGRAVTIQGGEEDHPPAVIHAPGKLGDAVFILRGEKDKTAEVTLQLPDGRGLPVPLGKSRAAWLLLNVKLGDAATLDFTNLRPWAFVDRKMLVLYGPAGAAGLLSLDGALHPLAVPTGKKPHVCKVGPVTVAVLNENQVDASYLATSGLIVGAGKLDEAGQPVPLKGWATQTHIAPDGAVQSVRASVSKPPAAPKLSAWDYADCAALIDGSDERYEPIAGPASLAQLGVHEGYGWYRIANTKPAAARATKTVAPHSGDRLHVYRNGKLDVILGRSLGASRDPESLSLAGDVVVLADHLGRFNYGQRTAEPVGLRSHFCAVKAIKLGKPVVTTEPAPDPFEVAGLIYYRRQGQTPLGTRLAWTVKLAGKKPLLLRGMALPPQVGATVCVNAKPIGRIGEHTAGENEFLLDPTEEESPVKTGNNELAVHFDSADDAHAALAKQFTLFQVESPRTEKSEWAFTPWTMPADDAFGPIGDRNPSQPGWFRCTFEASPSEAPLFFDASTLSKGQVFLNGRNVGRYFCQTATRAKVPPQSLYYLPEPWLNAGEPNVLTVFDEHGFAPTKAKLAYKPQGPFH